MNTWAKYVISFFILVVVLSVLVFTFGPKNNRESFRDGRSPVGQLPSDHVEAPGTGVGTSNDMDVPNDTDTTSATSRPANDR